MQTKDKFVEKLQEILAANGIKASKEKAWKVFKGFINDAVVEGVLTDTDNKISLAGIGNFEMLKATARGTKEGVVDFVPKLRWRPSSRIDAILEERTGQVPDPEKRAAKRAEMEKAGTLRSNLPPRGAKKDEAPAEKGKEETTGEPDEF